MDDEQVDTHEDVHSEKQSRIQVRWILTALMFVGTAFSAVMRANMSVAIVSIVNGTYANVNLSVSPDNTTTCGEFWPNLENQNIHWNQQMGPHERTFNWSVRTQAVILGSFYYGWTASTLGGSILVQQFGAVWPFGLSVFFSAICTLLSPLAVHWNVESLIILRISIGISQGFNDPARNVLICNWIPLEERGRVNTILNGAMDAGVAIGMFGVGILSNAEALGGWPSAFYFFGTLSVLWFLLWAALAYEDPSLHPWITEAELDLIHIHEDHSVKLISNIPWKDMLSSIPVWTTVIAVFGQYWGYTMLMSELPTYFVNILNLNIKTNGLFSALPYVVRFASCFVSGPISDKLVQSHRFTISTVRKVSNSLGMLGSGSCILLMAFLGCHLVYLMIALCLTMFFSSFTSSGSLLATMDMCPEYTGIVSSMCYTSGGLAAILTPLVAGEIVESGQTLKNWGYVYICTAAVMFVAGIIYNVLGTAEPQVWASGAPPLTSSEEENTDVDVAVR